MKRKIRSVCLETDTGKTISNYYATSKEAVEGKLSGEAESGSIYGISVDKIVMEGDAVLETEEDTVENISYNEALVLEMINKMADGTASPGELVYIVDSTISELDYLHKL